MVSWFICYFFNMLYYNIYKYTRIEYQYTNCTINLFMIILKFRVKKMKFSFLQDK